MEELFTRVTESEFKEICEFHERYPESKRPMYAWKWEYGSLNPNLSVLIGIKDGNRYVGTQGMYTIKLCVDGKVELTGKNESLLIEQDYRGTGLSKRLYNYSISEYSKEGITCLWGFSRKAIVPLQRANFIVYFDAIKRTVLSLDIKQAYKLSTRRKKTFAKHISNSIKVFIGTTYSKIRFRSFKGLPRKPDDAFTFCSNLKDPNDLLVLYANLRKKTPDLIHIHQDNAYFKWRIEDSPLEVERIFLYREDELLGYLYLTYQTDYCEITDLTFLNENSGRLLISKMKLLIEDKNLKFLYYTYNSKNALNLKVLNQLKKLGFISTSGPNHFVLRNFTHSVTDSFFEINRWYINNLWSEGI